SAATDATVAHGIAIFRIMILTPLVARCTPALSKVSSRHRARARSAVARCPGSGIRAPKIAVVGKFLQRHVVASRLQQRKRQPHEHVDEARQMPLTSIDWVQPVPQMQLWIVVQTAALQPPVTNRYVPANNIEENIVIKM